MHLGIEHLDQRAIFRCLDEGGEVAMLVGQLLDGVEQNRFAGPAQAEQDL